MKSESGLFYRYSPEQWSKMSLITNIAGTIVLLSAATMLAQDIVKGIETGQVPHPIEALLLLTAALGFQNLAREERRLSNLRAESTN